MQVSRLGFLRKVSRLGEVGSNVWCCTIGNTHQTLLGKAGGSSLYWEGAMQKRGCFFTASKPELLRKGLLPQINKQIAQGKVWCCLGFFSGIFYFFLDFLWEVLRHVHQIDNRLKKTTKNKKRKRKRERKGEKNWWGGGRAQEVGTQAKENELVRRCYENSRQVRRVWSKVYWCCVKKKIIKKGQNKTVNFN